MSHSGKSDVAHARGFTLAEILVAVSVVVILAALLIAGVSRAQELGRRTACLSNLNQLSLASLCFQRDHRGALPGDGESPGAYWYQQIRPYDTNMAANAICPDAGTPADPSGTSLGVGSATQAWGLVNPDGAYGWLHGTVCSYGMNAHAAGYSFAPVVAAYGAADFGGNTTYYGSIASATSVTAHGRAVVSGSIQSGGAITLNGNISVGGTQSPNMPGVQPPSVQAIYNQIMQTDNPSQLQQLSGGNGHDYTGGNSCGNGASGNNDCGNAFGGGQGNSCGGGSFYNSTFCGAGGNSCGGGNSYGNGGGSNCGGGNAYPGLFTVIAAVLRYAWL